MLLQTAKAQWMNKTGTPRSHHTLAALMIAAVCLFFLYTSSSSNSLEIAANIPGGARKGSATALSTLQDVPCATDLELLKNLKLSPTIKYSRRSLRAVRSTATANLTDQIDAPFEYGATTIDLASENLSNTTIDSCAPIVDVQIPALPARADASSLIFGVATNVNRLEDSLAAFQHWAGFTRTRIVAILEPASSESIAGVKSHAELRGIDLTIQESGDEYNDRYFSLIKVLNQERNGTQWAVIIDDDTFFPSMQELLDELALHDHTQPLYLGGLSEDFLQLGHWGYMGYGGAGVFLSTPMLEQLADPAIFDVCNEVKWTGDSRLANCIYKHTTTKLTPVDGLHQLDLHGDMAGFYESGRKSPLSVHHWKSWYNINMAYAGLVGPNICGDKCVLHRWRFADGWYLTNGFSIVKYSNEYHDTESSSGISMEKTWDNYGKAKDDSYAHSLSPLRERDLEKQSFLLEWAAVELGDATMGIDTKVRQIYVKKGKALAEGDAVIDEVVEVIWQAVEWR